MSASSLVQVTSPTEGVRVITLNRPEKRNAMSQGLIGDLLQELKIASTDSAVKAIVITGNGTFFSGEAHYCLLSSATPSPGTCESRSILFHLGPLAP